MSDLTKYLITVQATWPRQFNLVFDPRPDGDYYKCSDVDALLNRECKWKCVDEDSNDYDTECRNAFRLDNGTPQENDMKYCCFCGGKIRGTG